MNVSRMATTATQAPAVLVELETLPTDPLPVRRRVAMMADSSRAPCPVGVVLGTAGTTARPATVEAGPEARH